MESQTPEPEGGVERTGADIDIKLGPFSLSIRNPKSPKLVLAFFALLLASVTAIAISWINAAGERGRPAELERAE